MMGTGERLRANAWGKYYVTDDCNGCGICAILAPHNFERSSDGTYYSVIQQPLNDAQERAVRAAMWECPLHCIKDDWD